jgi:hypothetical protein
MGFGDSMVVLADRKYLADIDGRRSSNQCAFGSGRGKGDWVLVIG